MYAKSKSNVVAKLDGFFENPKSATKQGAELTEIQQAVFNAPVPGSASAPPAAAPSGLPSKPQTAPANANALENRGQKRPRDEEDEDDDSDVAMEEDSDDD